MGRNVGKEAGNRTVERLGGLRGGLAIIRPTSPGAQLESRSRVEKALTPAGPSVPRGRPRTQSGARERRGEGEEGEGIEEETPEARGEEGRPSPSAWVRGRGLRLEAALGAPMVVQLAGRLGRSFYSSPPHLGLRWPRPIKHLCLHNRLHPLAPAEGLLAENTKITIWV